LPGYSVMRTSAALPNGVVAGWTVTNPMPPTGQSTRPRTLVISDPELARPRRRCDVVGLIHDCRLPGLSDPTDCLLYAKSICFTSADLTNPAGPARGRVQDFVPLH
jgi:hypothetical protein